MWPIFLINLDRSRSRLAASKALFDGAGLEFQRFSAVDWQDLSPDQIERFVTGRPPLFAKSKVSLPEVACFLSHIGVWQKIAAGSAPAAFVFEDDFHLEPGAAQAMSLLSAARPTWDMLKLFAGKERSTLGTVHTCGGHRIEIPTVLPSTTVAYAITRSAARELADRSFPVRRPVDLYLKHWWEHQALIKVIQPSLVTQSESHLATSSIDAARGEARSGNLMSRLFRNLGYQAAFRFNMMLHARSRRLDAAWPMEEQLRAPVTRREVRQAAAS